MIPYSATQEQCPIGPDREPVVFRMDDENDTSCSWEAGDRGEGRWLEPQAEKSPLPDPCRSERRATVLSFCRVSVPEESFRAVTRDSGATRDFYAVLRFGDRCPPGSLEVEKRIQNETTDNRNSFDGTLDALYPNEIVDQRLGGYTRLFFCFFAAAGPDDETMDHFPELGFPYAVFHDFEGSQPNWVIQKHWKHSDDSNNGAPDTYSPDPQSNSEVAVFTGTVEGPALRTPGTYFDLARVR